VATVDTGSYIYRRGAAPVTRTAISTRAKVFSYLSEGGGSLTQIGVLSEFTPSHSRAIETRRGIGYGDQIAELIPQNEEAVSIAVTRTMLYLANVMQVFGYEAGTSGLVRALKHHRFPFDVQHELVIPITITGDPATADAVSNTQASTGGEIDDVGETGIITFYEGCWFQDYNVTYSVDDVVLTESATILCTDIYDPNNQQSYGNATFGTGGNASTADFGNVFSRRFSQTTS
jgi:hypothetical protein